MRLGGGVHVIEGEFWGRPLYLPLFVSETMVLVDTGLVAMGEGCVLPYLEGIGRSANDLGLIALTHAHADHIGGNRELWLASGRRARFVAHAADRAAVEDPLGAGAAPYQRYVELGFIGADVLAGVLRAGGEGVAVDITVTGGERFALGGGMVVQIIASPGHTPGSISLYERSSRVLASGESVAGRGQYDARGNLSCVPYYYDVKAYLSTLARLARCNFEWLVGSHVAPMRRAGAKQALAESLEFCVWFDRQVHARVEAAHDVVTVRDICRDMESPWGRYPGDLGMAMLIEVHLTSLLRRGLIAGSLDGGVRLTSRDRDALTALIARVTTAIEGMGA